MVAGRGAFWTNDYTAGLQCRGTRFGLGTILTRNAPCCGNSERFLVPLQLSFAAGAEYCKLEKAEKGPHSCHHAQGCR